MSVQLRAEIINDFLVCPYLAFNYSIKNVKDRDDKIYNVITKYVKFKYECKTTAQLNRAVANMKIDSEKQIMLKVREYFTYRVPQFISNDEVDNYAKKGGKYITGIKNPTIINIGDDIAILTYVTYVEKKYKPNYNGSILTLNLFNNNINNKKDILEDWSILALMYDAYKGNYNDNLKLISFNYVTGNVVHVNVNEKSKSYVYSKIFRLKEYINYWYNIYNDKDKLLQYKTYSKCKNCPIKNICIGDIL
jgi:hypothetical protein